MIVPAQFVSFGVPEADVSQVRKSVTRQAVAADNLRIGLTVIADSVNPLPITRNVWLELHTMRVEAQLKSRLYVPILMNIEAAWKRAN